ncbi:MAG: hypothetical protein U1E65_24495 [Myxococcota bacterium]
MRAQGLLLLVLGGLTACTAAPEVRLLADLPEEVAWVSALDLDQTGRILEATGILRRSPATYGAFAARGDRLLIVGWTEAQLSELAPLPTEPELANARLSLADLADPVLPTPRWAGEAPWGPDPRTLSATTAPGLSASWLPRCPQLSERRADAELTCLHCSLRLSQTRCSLTIETACPIGRASASLDGQGRIVFDSGQTLERCTPSVSGGYDCETTIGPCGLELYAGTAPPAMQAERLEVLADRGPLAFVDNQGRQTDSPQIRGYLGSMTPLGSGVVVSAFAQPTGWYCALDGLATDKSSSLVFVDGAGSLAVGRTATAPPCLSQLLPDPAGPGFLGIFGVNAQELGRFDGAGRLTSSVALLAPPGEPALVINAALSRDGSRLGVLLMPPDGLNRHDVATGWVEIFDARSLAQIGTVWPAVDHSEAILGLTDGRFLVFEGDDGGAAYFDGSTRVVERASRVEGCGPPDGDFGIARAAGLTDTGFLLAGRGVQPLLFMSSFGFPDCRAMTAFDHDLEPYAVLAYQNESALFGGQTREGDGYLGMIDTQTARMRRGPTPLGRGQVTSLALGPTGAIWALMPGSASLARVIP